MNIRFFLLNFFVLVTLIALMQLMFPQFTGRKLPHWGFHFLFVYLFLTTLGGTFFIEQKMKSKPKEFINAFMMVSSIRMLLAVLIVVILILKTGNNAKFLAVFFAFGYMCFLVNEVAHLFKRSKRD
jgi:hypothetical protein